jgi:two-component system response regulator VicR
MPITQLRMSHAYDRRVFKETNAARIPQMNLTILHVEDNEVVADAVKETLEEQGWSVVSCSDGAMALNRLATEDAYDLLILDNELPNASGAEIVRYVRSLPSRQHTPIIMFSGSANSDLGANVYLNKPNDIDKLIEAVVRLTG